MADSGEVLNTANYHISKHPEYDESKNRHYIAQVKDESEPIKAIWLSPDPVQLSPNGSCYTPGGEEPGGEYSINTIINFASGTGFIPSEEIEDNNWLIYVNGKNILANILADIKTSPEYKNIKNVWLNIGGAVAHVDWANYSSIMIKNMSTLKQLGYAGFTIDWETAAAPVVTGIKPLIEAAHTNGMPITLVVPGWGPLNAKLDISSLDFDYLMLMLYHQGGDSGTLTDYTEANIKTYIDAWSNGTIVNAFNNTNITSKKFSKDRIITTWSYGGTTSTTGDPKTIQKNMTSYTGNNTAFWGWYEGAPMSSGSHGIFPSLKDIYNTFTWVS